MAHETPGRRRRLSAARACALLAVALPAAALDVGEPRVRSAIGQPLDASLPVRANPGERFAGKCFSVAPGAGVPEDPEFGVTLERSRGRANLRVRTGKPIDEPAIGLRVGADCEKPAERLKDIPLLIDLPGRAPSSPKARPPEAVKAEMPGAAAEMKPAAAPARRAVEERTARHPPSAAAVKPPPSTQPPSPARLPSPAKVEASAKGDTAPPKATPARPAGGGFQLKLSTGEMDLAPSKGIDEGRREQLRGRLALLDADDQLSAMLAMRHQLQQLESKVAALQLKVAQMPESFPAPKPAPAPAPAPKVEAPKPEPPKIEAPVVEERAVTKPTVEAPAVAPKPKPLGPRPASLAPPGVVDQAFAEIPGGWPTLAGAVAGLLALGAGLWWWRRRRADQAAEESLPPVAPADAEPSTAELVTDETPAPSVDLPLGEIATPIEPAPPSALAAAPAPPPEAEPAPAPEALPHDAASLRQRYIAERFPEVAGGSIDLADPESVIKGARLFYEDGELPRAVELLQYTIENDPDEPRPWLALFEIFRLERLGGEYSKLAARFHERFGDSEHWQKVRFFGREVDAGNALYRDETPQSLETIGPREARRIASQNATYDPVTENWLRAPMDFQNEVLATELRRALMADASLAESDLVPNPMPALRDIEMFTVA